MALPGDTYCSAKRKEIIVPTQVNEPIRFGSVVNLQNISRSSYLDSRGRVQDKPQFKGSPERVFVSTYPSVNRHWGSGSWRVISADGKPSGAPLSYGDRVHLLNLYPGVGYLDTCSRAHDFTPFKDLPDAYGVFTYGGPDRDHGSGTWIVESVGNKPSGSGVLEGDSLALRNAFPGAGYLYAYGNVRESSAFAEYNGTDAFVFAGLNTSGGAESRSWKVSISPTHSNFELDDKTKAGLIPMTDRTSVYQYTIKLGGGAIKGDQEIPLHFDTGSWDVCIPERYVNDDNCKPVKDAPVYKPWGLDAVRMTGDFVVKSCDGKTCYELKEFVFFKILDNEENKNVKSKLGYLTGIVGGFPSKAPLTNLPSFSYALAESCAAKQPKRFGFGIISQPPKSEVGAILGVAEGWSAFGSFLVVGAGLDILRHVTWRSDIPLWHKDLGFCPEAVPGFSAEVSIPNSSNPDKKIASVQYIATIDTGAPDFTARLGKDDPHLKAPFSDHFTAEGAPSWWAQGYDKYAKYLTNARVKIVFTDDLGIERFYTYDVGDKFKSPATFVAATWDSPVPWGIKDPQTPQNRANLGNTIYYYASIMYYDFEDRRVGFYFV